MEQPLPKGILKALVFRSVFLAAWSFHGWFIPKGQAHRHSMTGNLLNPWVTHWDVWCSLWLDFHAVYGARFGVKELFSKCCNVREERPSLWSAYIEATRTHKAVCSVAFGHQGHAYWKHLKHQCSWPRRHENSHQADPVTRNSKNSILHIEKTRKFAEHSLLFWSMGST